MRELVARVEAALRRSGIVPIQATRSRIEAPGLVIDADRHQALLEGADAGLTRWSSGSCTSWPRRTGKALTRDRIQQRVWGTPYRHRDRTVDVCVRKLREKIDRRSEAHTYIQTHPGVGYRFEPISRGMACGIGVLGTGRSGGLSRTELVESVTRSGWARARRQRDGGGVGRRGRRGSVAGDVRRRGGVRRRAVMNCTNGPVALDVLAAAGAENLAGKV